MTTLSLHTRRMELLVAYARQPSLSVRNKLVELNIGLVRKVAHQLSRQCTEPYEDLQQVGCLGLIRAIERFDPHKGTAFSSFALPYIRGEVLHYLRDKSSVLRIPRRWQELNAKARKARKKLIEALGRTPKDTEIAEALGVSLQEWCDCKIATGNHRLLSLDAPSNSMMEDSMTLADTLPDPDYQSQKMVQEERLQLQGAMNQLEEKTKVAIECVFINEFSRKETAKKIGISPMTVTRHLHKGIAQLEVLLEKQAA
ncbi:RNA polymerase sigma factor SigF [Lusitaniella coriacea LEGE 07157]|uniref:RNA polymerase sigma factor SigF n=1 Tax=Lusitaniella coriacea LEGE 07157 TaxID=945747 RepID=A0A8J7DZ32_9CYAN|nr:RNA polymerase sigma factor SigF [Lusitaniella coriacea]MBE9118224.1 RNA polymerase sigma factor SigF [Lusitaniella coriacea LEGE 07157]